jgi:long-chain fatty acid transport protein
MTRTCRPLPFRVPFAIVTAARLGTGPAQAGGLRQHELGTAEAGLAAAGIAARAHDAPTAVTNPAGMTQLQ